MQHTLCRTYNCIKGEGKANKELISSCRHTVGSLNSALKSPYISPVQMIRSLIGKKKTEICNASLLHQDQCTCSVSKTMRKLPADWRRSSFLKLAIHGWRYQGGM
ncbi:hypothetical protein XENTR_v10022365 [Xenopus tropicalis]|nr:hypothetical protein XENTR_v10022365 [Xenopus tropicalis]